MINLKELEIKITKILENETEVSLTQWLLNKRHPDFMDRFSSGDLILIENCFPADKIVLSSIFNTKVQMEANDSEDNYLNENIYCIAA